MPAVVASFPWRLAVTHGESDSDCVAAIPQDCLDCVVVASFGAEMQHALLAVEDTAVAVVRDAS
jgi:hypothetical protein